MNSYNHRLALALVAALALSAMNGSAGAEDSATVPTDPGFNPGSGQINPGVEEQAPSQSSEVTNIPTPEESRWALMTPVSKQPSTGETPSTPRPEMTTSAGSKEHQEVTKRRRRPAGPHHRRLGARFEFGRVRSTVHFCKDNRVGHIRRATAIRADRLGRRDDPSEVLQA